MILSLIAAADENNVIGGHNKLLWHLPLDMKRFRALTTGHPIIMGRKTFEAVGRLLPGRRNIVITSKHTDEMKAKGCDVVASLDEAIELASRDSKEVFVIGGGEIYKQALDRADKIYFTRVHGAFEGDVYFPEIEEEDWNEIRREEHNKDAEHAYAFTFIDYERKQS